MDSSFTNGIDLNGSGSGDCHVKSSKAVNHKNILLDDIGDTFLSEEFCDFTLISEEQSFPAHKYLLAARSNYFKKIISSKDELDVPVSNVSMKAILKYIYQADLLLSDYDLDTILELIKLAKLFELYPLVTALSNCIVGSITLKNIWFIYNTAENESIESLYNNCLTFMDNHAIQILNEESTLSQPIDNLKMILDRPTFFCPEVEKFKAIYNWINRNPTADQKGILKLISLERFGQEELLETVRPTKLINDTEILDAIDTKKRKRARYSMDSSTNTDEHKFDPSAFAFTPKCNIKTVKHETETGCFYYLAEFPEPFDINYIKIRLSELINNKGEFSYYVEVSLDNNDWTKVIDYSNIVCRSWQNLYFDLVSVKYIRVIGTKLDGTINDIIIDFFEAKRLINNVPEYENGFVIPNEDIANLNVGTRIKYPANRHDLFLFSSTQAFACFIPVRSFGNDYKKNAFTIQFAQPYMIDSMEFKIYFKDKDIYKYTVEVSLDEQNWIIVDDKSEEGAKGLQRIKFERRPVTFVRIVGIGSAGPGAGKFIGCSMFKCPASIEY